MTTPEHFTAALREVLNELDSESPQPSPRLTGQALRRTSARRTSRMAVAVSAAAAVVLFAATFTLSRQNSFNDPEPAIAASSSAPVLPALVTNDWRPGKPSRLSLLHGVLAADDTGCLSAVAGSLEKSAIRRSLIWPAGYTSIRAADGTVVVLGPDGAIALREGDSFSSVGSGVGINPRPCDGSSSSNAMNMQAPPRLGIPASVPLGPTGDFTPCAPRTPPASAPAQARDARHRLPEYRGLRLDEAATRAEASGLTLREIGRDGDCQGAPAEPMPMRVNVYVERGRVVWAATGW